jgi:hypothetical protein
MGAEFRVGPVAKDGGLKIIRDFGASRNAVFDAGQKVQSSPEG